MHEFKHPNYYKELRKRNKEAVAKSGISSHASLKSDQAISDSQATADDSVRSGPGLKLQASEDSTANSTRGRVAEPEATSSQASSDKPQAPSNKRQAPSRKLQADES